MREYKMRRGEHLSDRIPDMEATVEDYFGSITDTEEYKGNDLHVVEDPDNPVFDHVVVGTVAYSSKKDKLAMDIVERPAEDVIAEGNAEAAEEAVSIKNEFLLEATGRDAKARRDSMKRAVEDDPDEVDDV
jgi:carboxypeptidase C (cathepsin A)